MTTTDDFRAWFDAVHHFTAPFVDGQVDDDEGEILTLFTSLALSAAGAQLACLYLPSIGGRWLCEVADGTTLSGQPANTLIGKPFDFPESAQTLLKDGAPVPLGNTLLIPILIGGSVGGCLRLDKHATSEEFSREDQDLASAFARQGGLGLDLLAARQAKGVALMMQERERISRDLHDLGIQHLFATGMALQGLRQQVATGLSARETDRQLHTAMERLDEGVRQIRNIVYELRDEDDAPGLVEAIEQEASIARTTLGFAPAITFEVNGALVRPRSEQMRRLRKEAPKLVGDALTADITAVVREALTNIARHAYARSAQVTVSLFGSGPTGEVQVLIVDDGEGVDPSQSRSSGMANMQRRAAEHNGSFAVSSGPRGRGTSLVWRSPLTQN